MPYQQTPGSSSGLLSVLAEVQCTIISVKPRIQATRNNEGTTTNKNFLINHETQRLHALTKITTPFSHISGVWEG